MIKAHQQFDLLNKKVFEKAVVEPPFRVVGNFPDEACFYYLVKGGTQMYTPTEKLRSQEQEGLAMQCGTYLSEFLSTHEGPFCEAIAVHLYPDVIKTLYDKDFPDFIKLIGQVRPLGYRKYEGSLLLTSYIDSLQFYFQHPELVSEELLKLKLKELILLLAKTDNSREIQRFLASLFTENTLRFKEVVEANVYNNLKMEELAALTGLSLSSFKREFEKQYGNSPARYIKKRKLEQAAKMLKGTELRISEVAFDTGFNDLAHFSKSFQKEYGVSPSTYRVNFLNKSLG